MLLPKLVRICYPEMVIASLRSHYWSDILLVCFDIYRLPHRTLMARAGLLDSVPLRELIRGCSNIGSLQDCACLLSDDESRHATTSLLELVRFLSQAESQQKRNPEAGADVYEA
jgi:hypothetical protein